ncbi:MAG: beta-lactamase family protein, partial [Parvularculaceae bacterium]|nr:beta-lactamase family protein [Parvularculaceae bacterium]
MAFCRTAAAVLGVFALAIPSAAHADPELQKFLEETLVAARDKNKLPAVAALVQIDGKIEAEAALGVRALGHPEPATTKDRWHIGSDTKAFTATLIARLVEKKVLRFDDTLAASFPSFAKAIDPGYRTVTIAQLLSHTAGLPALTDEKDLADYLAASARAKGVRAQRSALARHYLKRPPASKVGEFAYSNVGYIIAGAIAEARTGKAWEDLIRVEIFAPLGIVDAGFGPPGEPGRIDQPRGHRDRDGALTPLEPNDPNADNPASLGPAGTINITLRDWLLFAQD